MLLTSLKQNQLKEICFLTSWHTLRIFVTLQMNKWWKKNWRLLRISQPLKMKDILGTRWNLFTLSINNVLIDWYISSFKQGTSPRCKKDRSTYSPSLSYKIRRSLAFYVKAFLVMFLTAYFSSMDIGIAFLILLYDSDFLCLLSLCWLIWLRYSLDFLCFDQGRNRAGPREPRSCPPFVVY